MDFHVHILEVDNLQGNLIASVPGDSVRMHVTLQCMKNYTTICKARYMTYPR